MARPAAKQANWEQVLDEQEASGQSVADWCRSAGIKPYLIYPRKRARELQRRDAAARDRARRAEGRRGPDSKIDRDGKRGRDATPRPAFTPVRVIAPSTRARPALRVLAGNRAIEVDGDFDEVVLARLITVLEALPCS